MTGFGDFTDADAADVDPADPEAVARIALDLLRAQLPGKFRAWEGHTPAERAKWVIAFAVLLGRLRREGSI